jgi:tRNA pseudouridine-54 N-methylase
MDKLVKRVTVVQGGEHPQSTVVYESDEEDRMEREEASFLKPLERAVRHMLKADLIMAQDAYERHVKSAARGKDRWLLDAPSNMLNAQRKALKEVRKAASSIDEDEED